MSSRVRVVQDNTPRVLAQIRQRVAGAVKETAQAVETDAKARAPVKTGNLRDNIKADTAMTDAELRALVVAWAYYSVFIELGRRGAAAQPFLLPALEAARAGFIASLRAVLRGL